MFVFLSDTGLVGEETQCWTNRKRMIKALFAYDVYKMFEQCDRMTVDRKTEIKTYRWKQDIACQRKHLLCRK